MEHSNPNPDRELNLSDESTEGSRSIIVDRLRSTILEYNAACEQFQRLYEDVMGVLVPQPSDSERIEDGNFNYTPSDWDKLLSERGSVLYDKLTQIMDLIRLPEGFITLGRCLRHPSWPELHHPITRHAATDAAMIQYPQISQILGQFGYLRGLQERLLAFVTAARLPEEQPTLPKVVVDAAMLQDDNGTKECYICRADMKLGDEVCILPCKHLFCFECTQTWVDECSRTSGASATCPMCRTRIIL